MEHRSPKFEKPRLFDPRDSRPTIVKLGFPLMLWLGVFGLYHPPEKPGGLILLGLLALLSLFFLTLALIVPTDRYLEYKRFIQWRTISYKEVSKCGRSIFPLVGYIKLKRFLPPWGRLYFVFYTPSAPFFGRAEQEAILEHIQDKIAGRAEAGTAIETKSEVTATGPKAEGPLRLCALWALLGFVWALFLRMVLGFRPTIPTPSVFAHENILYRLGLALWRFGAHLLDWPYNFVVVLAISAVIVASRYRRAAWGPAAALGFFLGELLVRFIHR